MKKILGKLSKKHVAFALAFLVVCSIVVYFAKRGGVERATAPMIRTIQSKHRSLGGADSYLAVSSSSSKVDVGLYKIDDKSGRQRWDLRSRGDGSSNVLVSGGRSGAMYLSASKDGTRIYLVSKDDGSGLQRWQFKSLGGGDYEVCVFGGKGLANANAKYLYIDGKTGKLRLSTQLASNASDRNRQIWMVLDPNAKPKTTTAPTKAPTKAPTNAPTKSPSASASAAGLPIRTIQNQYREAVAGDSLLTAFTSSDEANLAKTDDKSGRQRWGLKSLGGGANNVIVSGGKTGNTVLSASQDGTSIYLVGADDGSGRQRWVFKNLYGRTFEISVYNGAGLSTPTNNVLTIDGGTGKLRLMASLPVSNANRSRQLWTVLQPGTTAPPETDSPQGCPPWAHARTEDYTVDRVNMLKDRAKQSFDVCQFGDSITARLDGADFNDFMNYYTSYVGIPREKFGNFGISGDTVQTLMHRLCNGGVPSGAKVVVFHIGTNNLRCSGDGNVPKQIALKAFKSIDFVRRYNPNAKVVVASIFNREMYPEKRKETNQEISNIIAARNDPNIYFTTAGEVLTMENTHNNDKLHPNPTGWRQIFDAGFGDTVKNALAAANQ